MTSTIIFFICSFVNVMLCTVKTIVTVKGTKHSAAIANAITYGFYAIVVQQLANLPLSVTVTATIITNLIGVYASMWLMDKFKKDLVWKISVTANRVDSEKIQNRLSRNKISYISMPVTYKGREKTVIDIFSNSQAESHKIKMILKNFKIKYHITELSKTL